MSKKLKPAAANLLTADQAAAKLGLDPSQVRRHCREGRLGFQVNGVWLIPADELKAFAKIERRPGRKPAGKEAQSISGKGR